MASKEPRNHRQKWSIQDENKLKKLRREGKPIRQIAEILGRTKQAIECRLYHHE